MSALHRRRRALALVALSGLVALAALALLQMSDLSPTWMALMLIGLGCAGLLAYSGRPQAVLFTGYVATLSVEISKGLIAEGNVYAPGLYLSLSDLFLFPLVGLRAWEHLIVRRQPLRGHPVLTAALLWLAWQWLRALGGPVPLGSFLGALNQTKYFLALWVTLDYLRASGEWRLLVRGVGLSIAMHFGMTLLQVGSGGTIALQGIKMSVDAHVSFASAGLLDVYRPSGLLAHPNALADYLVLFLPAGLGGLMLSQADLGARRWPWRAAVGAASLMLVLTLSRGGWIALAVGMAFYLWGGYRRGVVTLHQVQRVVAGAAVATVIVLLAFPTVYLRLSEGDNQSTRSRLLMADQALLIIERHPVAGVGLGVYNWAAQRNVPQSYDRISEAFRAELLRNLVHNKYLLLTAETGVIGLLLFVNVFRVSVWRLWRERFGADKLRQVMSLGLVAGIVAQLVTFMLEPAELGVPVETTWVALGLAAALVDRRAAAPRNTGAA